MREIRTVVADDDALFRDALVDVLEDDRRFSLVGVAATGGEAVSAVVATRPDLVVLDVQMPGGGVAAARAIMESDPERRPIIVAVSAQTGMPIVLDMLRAGASSYLPKGRLGGYLPDMLATCATGQVVLAAPGGREALLHLAGW